jgi:hypothetical protein
MQKSQKVSRSAKDTAAKTTAKHMLLKKSEKVIITGTILLVDRNIIVVQDGEDRLFNIIMAGHWYGGLDEDMELEHVIDEISGLATLKVLSRKVMNENGVSVLIYFCYEINDYHAILPYNIND